MSRDWVKTVTSCVYFPLYSLFPSMSSARLSWTAVALPTNREPASQGAWPVRVPEQAENAQQIKSSYIVCCSNVSPTWDTSFGFMKPEKTRFCLPNTFWISRMSEPVRELLRLQSLWGVALRGLEVPRTLRETWGEGKPKIGSRYKATAVNT